MLACQDCRHYRSESGECGLLIEGRWVEWLEEGNPCRPVDAIHRMARRLHGGRRGRGAGFAADVAQDLLFHICRWQGEGRSLPRGLAAMLRYLERCLINRESTLLRQWGRRARPRCGACRHYLRSPHGGQSGGCGLATVATAVGSRPHPHFGAGKVSAHQDPRKLDPPCQAFEGRQWSISLESRDRRFFELSTGSDSDPAQQAELAEEKDWLVSELDRLIRQDLRCVASFVLVCLEGKDRREVARRLGVHVKTVKRDVAQAMDQLRGAWERKRSRDLVRDRAKEPPDGQSRPEEPRRAV